MNKMPEAVTSKFIELFAVLHSTTDDLKMAGADAFCVGDFSQVATLTDSCRKLQEFEAEIKSTVNNFASNYNARTTEKASFHKKDKNRTRKLGCLLKVTVAGKVIEEATIKETFVKTLRAFGLERVAKLKIVVSSIPLLARTQVTSYQDQKRCEGWYITTHVNRHNATTVLEEIGKQLNMPVKVEFVER